MNSKDTKISVVCPMYNSSEYIIPTIKSIVDQITPPNEVVFVDNGSTDGTFNLVKNYLKESGVMFKWKVLTEKRRGAGAARNLGIMNASYPWVAFIDSDDLWMPEKILLVKNAIYQKSDINLIIHDETHKKLDGSDAELRYSVMISGATDQVKEMYYQNFFSTSAVCLRKEILDKYGCFDNSLKSAQDYELWLRIIPYVKLAVIPRILGVYNDREGNITSGNWIRRMRNELLICFKYRRYVGNFYALVKGVRIVASYFKKNIVLRG